MSLKYTVVLVWVICLSYKMVLTGCEVVWVRRDVVDSFHVGKDGCIIQVFVRILMQHVENLMVCVCMAF
jgi:hypothetical protein